ncbi:hypothetical protein [Mesorhizobium sp. Root157]|uniref:hypothetical protein n=1 Tax=Mesorhizobium sp. Root157 TaxID=1736477 RepID=UPI000ADD2217|nr:hypothetical protein [Mesorhizobium sp. Root157]
MASIVFDAALTARAAPGRRISYSRRKAFYAAAGRYHGTGYGYDSVVQAVDALVNAGHLVEHDKVKGGRATGWQSSFRPADHLADAVLPKAKRHVGELVRLKDEQGRLVAYRDTERTVRDRRFLETVNERIAAADIRLPAPGAVLDGHVLRFDRHAVYPDMKALYRVFNGGWTLGGRMYGGWWQQVRSHDRQHFTIDGGRTCEEDYPQLHPRLLYAMAGHRLDGDAYTLDGWDRKLCKRAFNIVVNAETYHAARGALLPYVEGDERQAAALIREMKRRHSPVARHFHSGLGIRLQYLDSEMAKAVLTELTVKKGIAVLPIHDGFLVREEDRPDLLAAMEMAFSRQVATVEKTPIKTTDCPTNTPHRKERRAGTMPPEPPPVCPLSLPDADFNTGKDLAMPSSTSAPVRHLGPGSASEGDGAPAVQAEPIVLPERVRTQGSRVPWTSRCAPTGRRRTPTTDLSLLRQMLVQTAAARVLASVGEGTGMAAAVERVIAAMTAEHPDITFPDSRPGPRLAFRETRSGRGSKSAPRLLTPGEVLAACIAEERGAEAERAQQPQATGIVAHDIEATF